MTKSREMVPEKYLKIYFQNSNTNASKVKAKHVYKTMQELSFVILLVYFRSSSVSRCIYNIKMECTPLMTNKVFIFAIKFSVAPNLPNLL